MRPLAVLPMYDRPEIRAATDRFWTALAEALRAEGLEAPDALDRERPVREAWLDPGLVLGQTCGLPYAQHLSGRVTLVGAPDYGIADCPPGHYCSVLVARASDPRRVLADFAGARAAFNEPGSQSGHAALLIATAPLARNGRFFAEWVRTGGHRASAQAVAEDRADLAALDAESWRLMQRHDDFAAGLKEIGQTPPTPTLPFITAHADPQPVARAVERAIAGLDDRTRRALDLRGFVRFAPQDYAPLPRRLAEAERHHRLPA